MTAPRVGGVTGVILCGGAGRRMGGTDKPLTLLHDKPMVLHVRERLAPQVDRVLISANANAAAYAQWGDAVIADEWAERAAPGHAAERDHRGGPLFGIRAALRVVRQQSNNALLFCCPGDAPRLSPTLVSRLYDALDTSSAAAYPHDGEQAQVLFVLLRASAETVQSLDDYLRRGERSVHGWLSTMHTVQVNARDVADCFVNINTAQELIEASA